jgi:hypothetical protein
VLASVARLMNEFADEFALRETGDVGKPRSAPARRANRETAADNA